MVGACLGVALSQQDKKVACVDPFELAANGGQARAFDQRATACSVTTTNVFKNLGIWPSLVEHAGPIRQIAVSKQGGWGRTRLAASDIQQPAFGYVIPNDAITDALSTYFTEASSAPKGYWGLSVVSAERVADKMQIQLSNDEMITANLLVVADGARSTLRESFGISSRTIHTQQMAVVCNVACTQPLAGAAFERFTHNGPLALLPLSASAKTGSKRAHYNLVWCGSEAETQARMALDETDFAAALNNAFGAQLGRFIEIGTRQMFPLAITSANSIIDDRVVVIGNAAQALHPVAGQGFNLGLRDAATLCDVLSAAKDCGDKAGLQDYELRRRQDRSQMLALTSHLAGSTGFASDGLASAVFAAALGGFGQWRSASNFLATRASGFQADLPSLCAPSV